MTSLSVVNAGGADCDDADPDPAGGGGAPFVVVVEDIYFTSRPFTNVRTSGSGADLGKSTR